MTQAHVKPKRVPTRNDLRCFCRGTPLLGMYGVDEDGLLYVHVKIHKQGRVFGETWHYGGVIKLRCRNCLRINKVTFVDKAHTIEAHLEESTAPVDVTENRPAQ